MDLRYDTNLETLLKEQAEVCESMSILHRNSHNKFNGYNIEFSGWFCNRH